MELLDRYFDISEALSLISFDSLVYIPLIFLILFIGKLVNDFVSPYSINKELTERDNKALAVSYGGYLFGQGIIVLGVFVSGEKDTLSHDVLSTVIWGAIGIIFLNIARIVNDKIIFNTFDNKKEIITDQNVGTGAVQCGSYIGTALIVRSAVMGESTDFLQDIMDATVLFIIGQIGFVIFGKIYQRIASYNVHEEIEKDNIAAGVSFGMTLIALGIIMSFPAHFTYSILAALVWFINGVTFIIMSRFIVDKVILPSHKLDDEIAKDRNWGAALIEGTAAIITALLINASFA